MTININCNKQAPITKDPHQTNQVKTTEELVNELQTKRIEQSIRPHTKKSVETFITEQQTNRTNKSIRPQQQSLGTSVETFINTQQTKKIETTLLPHKVKTLENESPQKK
jgi:hypothetical protein